MRPSRILTASLACLAVLVPTAASAAAGSWSDPTGDTKFASSDVTKFEVDNSIEGVVIHVYIAQDSTATRRQSSLRSELDVTGDGKADYVVAAQSPYVEGTLETMRGRQICDTAATYQKSGKGGLLMVGVSGDCLQYPLAVSASHTFLVSTDEERAVDTFGSMQDRVTRPLVRTYAMGVAKRSGSTVSLVADPSHAGKKAVLQVQRGKAWVTVGRAAVSSDGEATFRTKPRTLVKGNRARILWGGQPQVTFRMR